MVFGSKSLYSFLFLSVFLANVFSADLSWANTGKKSKNESISDCSRSLLVKFAKQPNTRRSKVAYWYLLLISKKRIDPRLQFLLQDNDLSVRIEAIESLRKEAYHIFWPFGVIDDKTRVILQKLVNDSNERVSTNALILLHYIASRIFYNSDSNGSFNLFIDYQKLADEDLSFTDQENREVIFIQNLRKYCLSKKHNVSHRLLMTFFAIELARMGAIQEQPLRIFLQDLRESVPASYWPEINHGLNALDDFLPLPEFHEEKLMKEIYNYLDSDSNPDKQ